MKIELRIIGLLCLTTAVAVAEMRTWRFQKSDKTVEGEVVGFAGKAVKLRGPDGKTVSIPIDYLSSKDRAYLTEELSKQWKDVEVAKLDNAGSGGRYKKCTVHGADLSGEIYLERLPRSVEIVLQDRNKQAAPMVALSAQIESQKRAIQEAKDATRARTAHDRAARHAAAAQRSDINVEMSNLHGLEANLAKLQKSYDESVQKTRQQTIVKMRSTGTVHKGLPVWECLNPLKPGL